MTPDVGPAKPARKRAPRARKAPAPEPTGEALLGVTDAQLDELKISREVAWYMVSRGYRLPEPWQVPRWKTPEPGEIDRSAVFDPARVDRVINAFRHLRHTKGIYAGRALMPDPWQIAYIIAPVFGWVQRVAEFDLDDPRAWVRVIRNLYVEVSRKNGKSTLLGGLGLYMACGDGEQGAECVTGATTRDQAGFVFDPVQQIAASSPALKPYVRALKSAVVHRPTNSYFKPIANAADAQHGANIHFGCIDELHVHKDDSLVEAIETGTGSRAQPLIALITTADDGTPGSIYTRKRNRIVGLAKRTFDDPRTYGVIWCAAEDEDELKQLGLDPFSVEAQMRANPGFGVSPTREALAASALAAQQDPASFSSYLRLHLGIRTKQAVTYLTLDSWDRNNSIVDLSRFKARECYGGLDLASTSDLTAFVLLFPDGKGGFDVLWRFWLPERAYDKIVKRTSKSAEQWRREGRIKVTDGDVVDDKAIVRDIGELGKIYKIKEIGFDPWNASAITNALSSPPMNMNLVEVRQGYGSLSSPLKELHRLLLSGAPGAPVFRHGGDPVARWMIGNLAVKMDESGNVKPDRVSSADKIDGVAATVTALARAMTATAPRRSAYEDHGVQAV